MPFFLLISAQITVNITWKHLSSFQSDLWAWEVALRHRLRREPLEHIKARTDLWPHEKPTGADDAMCYHSMHTLFYEKNNPLTFFYSWTGLLWYSRLCILFIFFRIVCLYESFFGYLVLFLLPYNNWNWNLLFRFTSSYNLYSPDNKVIFKI